MEALLTESSAKRLAKTLVELSKADKIENLESELVKRWPRNALPLRLLNGGLMDLTERMILISAPAGGGLITLARQISSSRDVLTVGAETLYTHFVQGREPPLPELRDHIVVLIEEAWSPDWIKGYVQRILAEAEAHQGVQLILCCMQGFTSPLLEGEASISWCSRGSGQDAIYRVVSNNGTFSAVIEKIDGTVLNSRPSHTPIQNRVLSINGNTNGTRALELLKACCSHPIRHSEALNVVAKIAKYKDWHSLQGNIANLR